ncbi:MAG: 50S ribosomal protein L6, partial [Dehalococcoidia bacterium]
MSRVGLIPIPVPQGVKVNIEGNEVVVEGSKGKLSRSFHPDIS